MPVHIATLQAKVALLRLPKITKSLKQHVERETRRAAKVFVQRAFELIPVYSGRTAGSLLPLARELNATVGGSPIDTSITPVNDPSVVFRWVQNKVTGEYRVIPIPISKYKPSHNARWADPNFKSIAGGEEDIEFEILQVGEMGHMFQLRLNAEDNGWLNEFLDTAGRNAEFFGWLKKDTPWQILNECRMASTHYLKTIANEKAADIVGAGLYWRNIRSDHG